MIATKLCLINKESEFRSGNTSCREEACLY